MSILRVKASTLTNFQGSGYATSFGTLPSAGNFIGVIIVTSAGADLASDAVADNQGNSYAKAVSAYSNNRSTAVGLYYAMNIGSPSGTFTVTATLGGGSWGHIQAFEFSGVATTSALDQISSAIDDVGSTSPSSGATPTTTSVGDVLLLAAMAADAAMTTCTVEVLSPTWTQEYEDLTNAQQAGEADTRIVTAGNATFTANWTVTTGSVKWTAAIATFKAGAAAPASYHVFPRWNSVRR